MKNMQYLRLVTPFIFCGLLACSTAAGEVQRDPSEKVTAILNVTIIDVEGGRAVPGQTVIIVNERIDRIGGQTEVEIPAGADKVDGSGLYLMPGLVDAHAHYFDASTFGRLMIANGVLLVRDMGMPNEYILGLRDQLNRGETLGPEMVTTGAMLDGVPPLIPTISMGVKTPEEGRAAVRQQAEAGVDMIKVYSRLDKDAFLAILDEAEGLGLRVVGHVPDTINLEEAAQAGLKSIEHWNGFEKVIAKLLGEPVEYTFTGIGAGYPYLLRLAEVEPEKLQAFYQRLQTTGVTLVPTVVTFKDFPDVDALDLQSLPNGAYIPQSMFGMWKSLWAGQTEFPAQFWPNWAQMVKEMNQAGIPLMVGTDLMVPGILPGFSVHEEMAIWQEAGISPAEVLRSATSVPAQFLGCGDQLGSITVGKTASMVFLRENPLEDVRNAQQIEGLFLRGQYYSRKDLDRLLEEAKEYARQPVSP